jgi:Protein of unknown function (DUF1579)
LLVLGVEFGPCFGEAVGADYAARGATVGMIVLSGATAIAGCVSNVCWEAHVKKIIGMVAVLILMMGVSMRAQAPQGAPMPGPEVKRLGFFVGTWKEVGTAHMGAMQGPEGKVTSTTKYEWLAGGFFIVGHSDTTTSMGSDKEMSVMGWDDAKKNYTYHAFDSEGEAAEATGALNGDTWTWTTNEMGGAPIKARLTIKEVSKTQYTFKMEISQDGNTWTTALETTATKVVAAVPPAK